MGNADRDGTYEHVPFAPAFLTTYCMYQLCSFCAVYYSYLTTIHMAASKSFSSVASVIWNALPNHLSSIPTLPVFRRALKHHLFRLAYPDSSAKSGMIKPAQCISLHDTVSTTAIAQHLRSSVTLERSLLVPRTKTKTIGPRGFYFASSAAWNARPVHLRDPGLSLNNFKIKLKTHFFS